MFDFHKDKSTYFSYQYRTSLEYVIPFVSEFIDLKQPIRVLEVGCAEAGVLKAFTELGHQCMGIELSPSRVELAKKFMADEIANNQVEILAKNIYDIDIEKDLEAKFDLIILKDVIEHIHNQDLFMNKIKEFLNPHGKIFFGFPPWMMPFGGHQQINDSKFLSKLPYYHLLPMPLYKGTMKLFGESQKKIDDLVEIKETGISIERFEKITKSNHYRIVKKKFYLTNPIYQYKFNLKVREQSSVISSIPWLRNFFTTCVYYLIEPKTNSK